MSNQLTGMRPAKIPSGIAGFDRMSEGGLPKGCVTAVIGTAGAGKTVFAMQAVTNLVRSGGFGVFVSFEQSPKSIKEGLCSFDWDARTFLDEGRIQVIDGRLRSDMLLSGAFDIAGLLATVEGAIQQHGESCIVFDGIDALLSLLDKHSAQRSELLRLQEHAEKLPSTIIVTLKAHPESSEGFEEIALYMSDCVIELERGAEEGMATRNLRILKYRNSAHAQSRVPFIMSREGIVITAIDPEPRLQEVSLERVSTGIPRLDDMMGGGLFRASSTLLSGAPGTAKTTLGAKFLENVCRHGESALAVFFDESPAEIVRNVRSVGIDLKPYVASGLLKMHGMVDRSAAADEFAHEIAELVRMHQPRHVLIDPASIFNGTQNAQNAIRRLIQLCKREGITVLLTSLLDGQSDESESSRSYVSTVCDNWIQLTYVLQAGERNRGLTIIKSRGTSHSNQVGELLLSDGHIAIADAYTEDGAVLMGSLRWQKERANEQAISDARYAADRVEREAVRSIGELERRRMALDAELADRRDDLDHLKGFNLHTNAAEIERREKMTLRRSAVTKARKSTDGGDEW